MTAAGAGDVSYSRNVSDPVWKTLFARSGNLCAMEGCSEQLFDTNGLNNVFIAHIRGVSVKGPRFESGLQDAVVNGVDNLLLLCNRHHNQVDKMPVTEFTPDRMIEIKTAHERKVDRFSRQLRESVFDASRYEVSIQPTTFASWLDSWDITDSEDDAEARKDVIVASREHIALVASLPASARQLLGVIVSRGAPAKVGLAGESLRIRVQELFDRAANEPQHIVVAQLLTLEEQGLGHTDDNEYDYDGAGPIFWTRAAGEIDVARKIRSYCDKRGLSIPDLYENQDWSVLD